MNPLEVLTHFPEEQSYEDWMGGTLNDALLFRGMIFHFDQCNSIGPLPDSKMTDFTVRGRDDVHLWGLPLDAWTQDKTMDYLEQNRLRFKTRVFTLENRLRFYIDAASRVDVESLSLSLDFTEHGKLFEVSGS